MIFQGVFLLRAQSNLASACIAGTPGIGFVLVLFRSIFWCFSMFFPWSSDICYFFWGIFPWQVGWGSLFLWGGSEALQIHPWRRAAGGPPGSWGDRRVATRFPKMHGGMNIRLSHPREPKLSIYILYIYLYIYISISISNIYIYIYIYSRI